MNSLLRLAFEGLRDEMRVDVGDDRINEHIESVLQSFSASATRSSSRKDDRIADFVDSFEALRCERQLKVRSTNC